MTGQHRDTLPPAAVAGLAAFVVLVVVAAGVGLLLALDWFLSWVLEGS